MEQGSASAVINSSFSDHITEFLQLIGTPIVHIIHFLDPIYQSDGAPAGLALSIVLLGFCVIIFDLYKLVSERSLIASATKVVSNHVGNNKATIITNFRDKLDAITKELTSNPVIGITWDEYCESMIPDKNGERVYISIRPFEYFNIHDTDREHVYLQRFWPNFFVAIGLILTFVGLILALDDAKGALDTSSTASAQQAMAKLQDLLSTAGAKFYTSLAGLFSSIFIVFCARHFNRSKNQAFKEFCRLIEECTIYQPDIEIHLNSERTYREQLDQLKLFNDTLVTKLADQLNEDLPKHLSAAITPLVEKLNTATDSLSGQGEQKLEELTKNLQEQLSQGTDQQIKGLTTKLEDISQSLTTVVQQINESSGSMQGGITEASEGLKSSVTELADMLKNSGAAAGESVNTAMSEMKTILGDISSTLKTANDDLSSGSKELMDHAASEIGEQTNVARQAIETSSKTISDSLNRLSDEMTSGFNELNQSVKNLNTSVSSTAGQMSTYNTSLVDVNDKVKETGSSLMRATQTANQIAQPLKDIVTDVTQATKNISDAQQTIIDNISASQQTVKLMSESITDVTQRFSTIDDSLGNAFSQITNNLNSTTAELSKFHNEIDKNFKEAVGKLQATVAALNDNIDELISD